MFFEIDGWKILQRCETPLLSDFSSSDEFPFSNFDFRPQCRVPHPRFSEGGLFAFFPSDEFPFSNFHFRISALLGGDSAFSLGARTFRSDITNPRKGALGPEGPPSGHGTAAPVCAVAPFVGAAFTPPAFRSSLLAAASPFCSPHRQGTASAVPKNAKQKILSSRAPRGICCFLAFHKWGLSLLHRGSDLRSDITAWQRRGFSP
jgi:hypothetical protein